RRLLRRRPARERTRGLGDRREGARAHLRLARGLLRVPRQRRRGRARGSGRPDGGRDPRGPAPARRGQPPGRARPRAGRALRGPPRAARRDRPAARDDRGVRARAGRGRLHAAPHPRRDSRDRRRDPRSRHQPRRARPAHAALTRARGGPMLPPPSGGRRVADEAVGLWIDGREQPAADGAVADVAEPAVGAPLATVARAGVADAEAAVAAAERAFRSGPWPRASAAERQRALLAFAARIRAQADELATLEARNAGKPIADARWEVATAAQCFEFY